MQISFVIGCYRSEHTISDVVAEIKKVVIEREHEGYEYQIILVNDKSPDNVLAVLRSLASNDEKIIVIDLARNVGKAAAVLAGCSLATGEYVVFMDDDGQCPLDRLWDLIKPLDEGYDISIADYPVKKQSLVKNAGSWVNRGLVRYLIGMPKGVEFSNFNVKKKFVCDQMCKYVNPFPNLQGLALQVTNNIAMVKMDERERVAGKSGYTFWRSLRLLVNGITGFSVVPLRIASVLGIGMSAVGIGMIIWLIVQKIMHPNILAGYTSILVMQVFVGGILMLLLGIIGEYLGRIYISINNAPQYTIREIINSDKR